MVTIVLSPVLVHQLNTLLLVCQPLMKTAVKIYPSIISVTAPT